MMMMIGGDSHRWSNPTVEIPTRDHHFDEDNYSPVRNPSRSMLHNISAEAYDSALAALQSYFTANNSEDENSLLDDQIEIPVDVFSCDNFRMFEFKVKRCTRARSHDWTECPFAHPGEKARRRDPRKCNYSGSPCPDFRKGGACKRGDTCEYAHGVFECWLHPSRYRTQPCKDGIRCRRRVCFFAHTPEQLRLLPYATSPDASPGRFESFNAAAGLFGASSPSSPPISWLARSESMTQNSINQLADSIGKMKLGMSSSLSPPYWKSTSSSIRVPFTSLPATPIRALSGTGYDMWDKRCVEPYRLSTGEGRIVRVDSPGIVPDVGWISELIE